MGNVADNFFDRKYSYCIRGESPVAYPSRVSYHPLISILEGQGRSATGLGESADKEKSFHTKKMAAEQLGPGQLDKKHFFLLQCKFQDFQNA